MARVFVTGVGIDDAWARAHAAFDGQAAPATPDGRQDARKVRLPKALAARVAREDRAILTDITIRGLMAASHAMEMAEGSSPFPDEIKQVFTVFTNTETVRDFHEVLDAFRKARAPGIDSAALYHRLGEVAETTHPLRLFRKLPTNTLYHLSKLFGLTGGGYPLRRMSLGGLTLVEEAFYRLEAADAGAALLCASGDMLSAENYDAFRKMGLLADPEQGGEGVYPVNGTASLVLETEATLARTGHRALAEITFVRTRFSTDMFTGAEDWAALHRGLRAAQDGSDTPVVALYDNGAGRLREAEIAALQQGMPEAETRSYKRQIGYSAGASALADVIAALHDGTIACGRSVVVQGTGAGTGCGVIALRKTACLAKAAQVAA
ncbi:hypothetical protein So717_33610 [Roseobacter cerasinus]|uniref:Uncharacterized protein n=1 Tax=Roseobacter cerasinus TaxID=2602289 RepID=A0A640VT93_9RHOB|nr:hypothetical protein [Roseobacter cerasinus]GFE51608.1 hypothetical protein So717_33610 [Roseobacter cerasinus]